MPKKNSSWGVNTKAAAANERKVEKKRTEDEARQKAIDDNLWKDENKLDQKKKERKEKEEQKKLDLLSRKQESKDLLEEEERSVNSKSATTSKGGKKVTLSEIDKIKELERKKQGQRSQVRQKEKSKITEMPDLETENPNRKMAEMLAEENAVEARNVEDALSVLTVGATTDLNVDKHPEKRMKAAYTEFEKRELPILKQEYPSLRLSQLKQMLHKEWQKSPENPMIQNQ